MLAKGGELATEVTETTERRMDAVNLQTVMKLAGQKKCHDLDCYASVGSVTSVATSPLLYLASNTSYPFRIARMKKAASRPGGSVHLWGGARPGCRCQGRHPSRPIVVFYDRSVSCEQFE